MSGWAAEVRALRPDLGAVAEAVSQQIAFTPSPRLFIEAHDLPNEAVRQALRIFGIRRKVPPALAKALLAYWAEDSLRKAGVGGGILTALILRGLKGKPWEEGLRVWAQALWRNRPSHHNFASPLAVPLWVEEPQNPGEALQTLSTWAKTPLLASEDRSFLYALKDSLMVYLWNRGLLRLRGLVLRRRPLPPLEALAEAYRKQYARVREVFQKGGYEALAVRFPTLHPEALPPAGVSVEAWAEKWAEVWREEYRNSHGDTLSLALLFPDPDLLLPLLNPERDAQDFSHLSWPQVLEEEPYWIDPSARHLLLAVVEEGGRWLFVHMPYRKAQHFRLPLANLPVVAERDYWELLGVREVSLGTYPTLLRVVRELGYPPERFPMGLALLSQEAARTVG